MSDAGLSPEAGVRPAQALREKADDPAFQLEWRKMKQSAKVRALAKISAVTGVKLPENAMLDVQVSPNRFRDIMSKPLGSGARVRSVTCQIPGCHWVPSCTKRNARQAGQP